MSLGFVRPSRRINDGRIFVFAKKRRKLLLWWCRSDDDKEKPTTAYSLNNMSYIRFCKEYRPISQSIIFALHLSSVQSNWDLLWPLAYIPNGQATWLCWWWITFIRVYTVYVLSRKILNGNLPKEITQLVSKENVPWLRPSPGVAFCSFDDPF